MNPKFRTLVGLKTIAVLATIAIPTIVAAELRDSTPPIEVWVRDHPHFVAKTTTFGQAIRTFHVHAHAGRLLDVEGKVIPGHARPGEVLLDGQKAPWARRLRDRDRIWVVNEPDRHEPLARRVIHVKGRRPEDPQFYLGEAPGMQVVTTGAISGKLVSNLFQPTGRLRMPKAVALTFDDGPSPVDTPRILSILRHKHVHATFFTIGYLVERYPQIVRKERRMGMVVADHSWSHPNSPPFKDLGPKRIQDEMYRAQLALQGLGVDAQLFRPPGGSTSVEVETIAKELHMRVVLWSIDPRDWRNGISPGAIVRTVLSNVRAGSIVILHDGGGDQSATLAALPKIINGIRKKHLHIVPVR
jgi:peptidoglycan-N-acetylglucosamine deacetylase